MFNLAETSFKSRLFTGTGKFSSAQLMLDAILASGSELVTLAMRRVDLRGGDDALLPALRQAGVRLLPNTSGAKTAEEALFAARLAREALGTHWIKLEIHAISVARSDRNLKSGGAIGQRGVCGAALLRRLRSPGGLRGGNAVGIAHRLESGVKNP